MNLGKLYRTAVFPFASLVLVLLVLGASAAVAQTAQTGLVSGFVSGACTATTFPGASISVVGTGLGTVSTDNGFYLIGGIPEGPHTIRVELIGYRTQHVDVTVVAGDTTFQDIGLVAPGTCLTVTQTEEQAESNTLEAAISIANNNPGEDLIDFAISEFSSTSGPHVIALSGALPMITDPVIIDGTTELEAECGATIPERSLQIVLSGEGENDGSGLLLGEGSDGSTVRGLVINGFQNNGILISGSNSNTIECNIVGTNVLGDDAAPNGTGILITSGTGNVIGGLAAGAGNLISGNSTDGVHFEPDADGNVVQGNFIGTDLDGTSGLGNISAGVGINGASGNTVGGTDAGARNVISANGRYGVELAGSGAAENIVEGNFIGLDVSGNIALGNNIGVLIQGGASANRIGGLQEASRNVISANTESGVELHGTSTSGNLIQGNYIGVDSTGAEAVGTQSAGVVIGEFYENPAEPDPLPSNNTIGGAEEGARNLISGNTGPGVLIRARADENLVAGNWIGLGASGADSVPNTGDGVRIHGATNVVGVKVLGPELTVGALNVISGNGGDGVNVLGTFASGNEINGNYIGLNASGTSAMGNANAGVRINAAAQNIVGGPNGGERNIISGNVLGVVISGSGATGNIVRGNYIGTNVDGSGAIGNTNHGIYIDALANTVGGSTFSQRNVISGNEIFGILLVNPATNNEIFGNYIGTSADGLEPIPNSVGVHVLGGHFNYIGGSGEGEGNLISGNDTEGILITAGSSQGNEIQGNLIGTAADGTSPLGNSNGIRIDEGDPDSFPSNNLIGGQDLGAGNTIAYNDLTGVAVFGGTNNGILSNSIHSNGLLGIDLGELDDQSDDVSPNDGDDSDTGPNNLQNFPVLDLPDFGDGVVSITGSLTSSLNSTFTIEFFASESCDPSGHGEGQVFIGSADVTTDGAGHAVIESSFDHDESGGAFITATATDADNNTSEFSTCGVDEITVPDGYLVDILSQGIAEPQGITVDGGGNVLVVASGSGEIYRLDPSGNRTLLANGFTQPVDVAIIGTTVYVSDYSLASIFEFSLFHDGVFTASPLAALVEDLPGPTQLEVGPDGFLYVSVPGDSEEDVVIRVDVETGITTTVIDFSESADPQGIGFLGEYLYLAAQNDGTILRTIPNGTVQGGSLPAILTGLDSPNSLGFGLGDRLYITTPSGVSRALPGATSWDTFLTGLSGSSSNGLYITDRGAMYISDTDGGRVIRVNVPRQQRLSENDFTFRINEDGLPNVSDGSDFAAFETAAANWTDVSTATASFTYEGTTPLHLASASDGTNIITATDNSFLFGDGVLAVAAKLIVFGEDEETAEIVDWDIVINPLYASQITTSGSDIEFDAEAIVTHEFGHVLGLTHTPVPSATMFYLIPQGPDFRTLSLDDRAWVSHFYPTGDFESNPSGIEGFVTDGNSGNSGAPVAGAFVIAIDDETESEAVHAYTDVDGSYFIPGLPANRDYEVLVGALDGDVWGTNMRPGNVNLRTHLIATITDFPVEYHNAEMESGDTTDVPSDVVPVSVNSVTSGIDFITNQDLTPPTVLAYTPQDGATDVAASAPVVFSFSEPVDTASVISAFDLVDSTGATVTGNFIFTDEDQLAVYVPSPALTTGASYTFTLEAGEEGVKDKHENALEAGIASTFTIDNLEPTVEQITPADSTEEVFITSKITIVFSEPIDPSTLSARTNDNFDPGFSLRRPTSPEFFDLVPGTFTFSLGNTVATFTPDENPPSGLFEATTYTVDINDRFTANPVTDASGNPVEEFSSSFSTVLEAIPEVVEFGPAPDAVTDISVETALYVDFSEPIDPTSAVVGADANESSFSLTAGSSSTPIDGTFEFLNDDSRLIFRPASNLAPSTTHTVTLRVDDPAIVDDPFITDQSGNELLSETSWTFTTASEPSDPTITAISPPSGTIGNVVTISGNGWFNLDPSENNVMFNGTPAEVSSSTLSSIVTTVPAGATTGPVTVDGIASTFDFGIVELVDLEDAATYRITSSSKPNDAEITPDGVKAWFVNTGEEDGTGTATPIDLTTLEVGAPVELENQPLRIAITPDGERAYVTNFGSHSLTMIDLTDLNHPTTRVPTGLNPVDVAISPDGGSVYVSEYTSESVTVLGGDPNSGVFNQATARISTSAGNDEIKVSPDGVRLVVAGTHGVTIITLDPLSPANSAVARVSSDTKTSDISISPDGGTAVAVAEGGDLLIIQIDSSDPANSAVARVSSSTSASTVEFSPDGASIYVTAGDSLFQYEIAEVAPTITAKSGIDDSQPAQHLGLVRLGAIEIDPCAQSMALNPTTQALVTTSQCEGLEGVITLVRFNLSPEELFQLLSEKIDDLSGSNEVKKGHIKELLSRVRDARKHYEANKYGPALNVLADLVHLLNNWTAEGYLPPDVADELIDLAERIISEIEGAMKGGVAEGEELRNGDLPTEFALQPNYPNPFNPTTTIEYSIPGGLDGPVHVRLEIFNILGQRVAVLVNEEQTAGRYHAIWNGRISGGAEAASGVYLFRIAMGDYQSVKKMTLLR